MGYQFNVTLVCLVSILVASTLPAVATMADDNVGIYFDEAATTNEIHVTTPIQVQAYMVVTGCTLPAPMAYFWGGVKVGTAPFSIQLRGDGANIRTMVPDAEGVVQIQATFATPLPMADALVIADIIIDVATDDPVPIWFMNNLSALGFAYEFQGAGTTAGDLVLLWQSTEVNPNPMVPRWPWLAACVNGTAPVATTATTWEDVKSLFR